MAVLAATRAEEKLAQIQSWAHWHEIGLVAQKEYGVSPEDFQVFLPEYQRFMTLIAVGYKGLGMHSEAVDKIWHSHMLYSQRYRDFCLTHIGRFVDHKPNLSNFELTSNTKSICEAPPTPPPEKCVPEPIPDTPPAKCGVACDYDDDPRDETSFAQAYLESFHMIAPAIWGIAK
jgi:hypothetical protein